MRDYRKNTARYRETDIIPRFFKGGSIPGSSKEVEQALGERGSYEDLKAAEQEFETLDALRGGGGELGVPPPEEEEA